MMLPSVSLNQAALPANLDDFAQHRSIHGVHQEGERTLKGC